MPNKELDRTKAFKEFPVLHTRRLVLREVTMDDTPWYLEHFSTKEIIVGQGYPGPDGLEGSKKELQKYFIDLFKERNGFRWGIELRDSKGLIGSLGYYKWVKPSGHQAEMGYDLNPKYWGRGIMTEAMDAVIEFGFRRMRLRRIEVLILTRNQRSAALIRRLGFKREGVMREHGFDENMNLQDEALYSLLRRDWLSRK